MIIIRRLGEIPVTSGCYLGAHLRGLGISGSRCMMDRVTNTPESKSIPSPERIGA